MENKNTTRSVVFILIKIAVLALIVLAVVFIGKKAYEFGYDVFSEETVSDPPGKDVVVTIPDGYGAKDVGRLLEEKKLIPDGNVFRVQELLSKYHNKIRAGTYTLNSSWTAEQILKVIAVDSVQEETETET